MHRERGPLQRIALYDEAGRWLGDYEGTGTPLQQSVWLDELPVGVLAGAGASQRLHYVQPDALGTPRVVIDPVRDVAVWRWGLEGEAFGNDAPEQDPDQDGVPFVFDMRFPGQRYDAASGLVQNYYREYEALTGRYTQSDPIGLAGGAAIYSYAGSDPNTNVDPFGLLTLFFFAKENRLIAVDQGESYEMKATSGDPSCSACGPEVENKGPIPPGDYRLYSKDLSNPPIVGDLLRNTRGDWGDWRVKLWPVNPEKTFGRDGFFLHGGSIAGSAGCIDVGGGIRGSSETRRLLNDILNDPAGVVDLKVR